MGVEGGVDYALALDKTAIGILKAIEALFIERSLYTVSYRGKNIHEQQATNGAAVLPRLTVGP